MVGEGLHSAAAAAATARDPPGNSGRGVAGEGGRGAGNDD